MEKKRENICVIVFRIDLDEALDGDSLLDGQEKIELKWITHSIAKSNLFLV